MKKGELKLITSSWGKIKTIRRADNILTWEDLSELFRRAIRENVLLECEGVWLHSASFYARSRSPPAVTPIKQGLNYVIDIATNVEGKTSKLTAGSYIHWLMKMAKQLPRDCRDMLIRLGDYWSYDLEDKTISYYNGSVYGVDYGGEEYIFGKKPINFNDVCIIIGKGESSMPDRG